MRRDSLLLVLIVAITISVFLSPAQRDLFVGDETKYGRIIWELRQTHSLLVPTLEGRPYSHKPPLHFWLVYLLTYLFGLGSTWAFVLPSLVGFVLMLLLIRKIAVELFGGSGMLTVFIFSTFYLAWGIAQTARMDMTFVLLTSYAILHINRFLEWSAGGPPAGPRAARPRNHLIIAATAIGIAMLVKGPMCLVIVVTLMILEWVRRRRLPRGNYLLAVVIAIGIPLLWLIPALYAGGREYTEELIVRQNLGRAINAWVHREPPWWYLQRFPLTFFPWFFVALMAIMAVYRDPGARSEERGAKSDPPAHRSSLIALRSSALFCVNWFLAVLIPFSLISGKLDVYMIPALVPIALLCGYFVEHKEASRFARIALVGNRVILVGFAALFAAIPLIAPRFAGQLPELDLLRRPLVAGLFWSTAAVALTALIVSASPRPRRALSRAAQGKNVPASVLERSVVALGVGCIYPMVYLSTLLMPIVNSTSSTRPMVEALRRQTDDGRKIGLWQSPHLWTSDMPPSYRNVEYLGRDRLRQPGEKPLVIATRADRAVHLGRELLEHYRKVDQLRMRGKQFDVYRRR